MKAPQSRLDRAAIAVRSDRDRGVLPRSVCAVRCSVRRLDDPIAIKRFPNLMTIRRFSSCHVASGKRSDRVHLNPSFAHVMNLMIAWTRVHAISAVSTVSDACSVSTSPVEVRTVWDIVPHGENSRFCCG